MDQPRATIDGSSNSWLMVEKMSSKKYDANIGRARHKRATHRMAPVSFRVLKSLLIFLHHIGQFQTITLAAVLSLEQEAEDEGQDTER